VLPLAFVKIYKRLFVAPLSFFMEALA